MIFLVLGIIAILVFVNIQKPISGEPVSILDIKPPVLEKISIPIPKPEPDPVSEASPRVITLVTADPVYKGKTVTELTAEEYAKIQAYYESRHTSPVIEAAEPVSVLAPVETRPVKYVLSYARQPDGGFRVRLWNNTYENWSPAQWADYTSPKY